MTSVGNDYLASLMNKPASTTATTTTGNSTQLDQDDFLKLMSAQLQTQDPFNPVDNTQMVAQMAQFSSTAGIAEMNQSLKSLVSSLGGSRVGDAASWIGRTALVNSDIAAPLPNGAYAGEVSLPDNADNLQFNLVDANGALVHSETLGAQAKGDVAFQWDGKDAAGNVAANGPLQVVVTAAGANGAITPTTSVWTSIVAVQSPASGADTRLVTPLGTISPTDALRLG